MMIIGIASILATCAPGVFPSSILGTVTSSHHCVASHLIVIMMPTVMVMMRLRLMEMTMTMGMMVNIMN